MQREVPKNPVIRQRISARTIGIHRSALPSELRALTSRPSSDPSIRPTIRPVATGAYLRKHQIPEQVRIRGSDGTVRVLSRDQAWTLADEAGLALESSLLSGTAGRLAAFFSATGQGVYANYGRPTLDFSGFFVDQLSRMAAGGAGPAAGALQFGPLLIALDTASAAGLTALGHWARGADLNDRVVVADVASTGAYEGSSAWATAKFGAVAGVKAMGLTAALSVHAVPAASILVGVTIGAAAAIAAKRLVNGLKNIAVDAAISITDSPVQNGDGLVKLGLPGGGY